MKVQWLERLLADRGIHGKIIEARLVSKGSDLMLDVRTFRTDAEDKRIVAVFDGTTPGSTRVAEERHLVPIGGMVLEPKS